MRAFKILLLCAVCGLATASKGIFFWKIFEAVKGDKKTLVDYSEQKVTEFKTSTTTYRYISGPVTFKTKMDSGGYRVRYTLIHADEDGLIKTYNLENLDVCKFFDNIFENYFLPIADNHNDFPDFSNRSVCPIEARTFNTNKIHDPSQLYAPTNLDEGHYILEILFEENFENVGGFKGEFTCKKEA